MALLQQGLVRAFVTKAVGCHLGCIFLPSLLAPGLGLSCRRQNAPNNLLGYFEYGRKCFREKIRAQLISISPMKPELWYCRFARWIKTCWIEYISLCLTSSRNSCCSGTANISLLDFSIRWHIAVSPITDAPVKDPLSFILGSWEYNWIWPSRRIFLFSSCPPSTEIVLCQQFDPYWEPSC